MTRLLRATVMVQARSQVLEMRDAVQVGRMALETSRMRQKGIETSQAFETEWIRVETQCKPSVHNEMRRNRSTHLSNLRDGL